MLMGASSGGGSDNFNGSIDEVGLFDAALSATDINSIMIFGLVQEGAAAEAEEASRSETVIYGATIRNAIIR